MQSRPRIYMDANATTQVLPAVLSAMLPYWQEKHGNASAVHSFGRAARGGLECAREQVASLIGGKASEITFTSGGTESDNLALFGLLQGGDHLIVSAVEHDAVLHAADALTRHGVKVSRVPCDSQGVVQPQAVAAALQPATRLVSVMLANNETGAIQPVREIADIAHAAGAWMHTDAVQACGKVPVCVQDLHCDLLSISGHKMHAAQGVGALWTRTGVPLRPMFHGGTHERRRRAGTENVPGIVALGEAASLAKSALADGEAERLSQLRNSLESGLLQQLEGLAIHASGAERLPNTSSISFSGLRAEELVIALDLQGLAISGGSACQSGAIEPSHVLHAMGVSDCEARSSVRFSLSRLNSLEEVERAVEIVRAVAGRMRTLNAVPEQAFA